MGRHDADINNALAQFWGSRDAQAAKQAASGTLDAGTRGAVTGGGHLNAVAELGGVIEVLGSLPQHREDGL